MTASLSLVHDHNDPDLGADHVAELKALLDQSELDYRS